MKITLILAVPIIEHTAEKKKLTGLTSFPKKDFYHLLSSCSSKMVVENSLLEIPGVNEKLTEIRIVKNSCRKRKRNFSAQEIVIVTKTSEGNQAVLLARCIGTNTNKTKHDVWEQI